MLKFRERIPVTVVGGFLGAGKTTLVNQLIKNGGKRFGVIVNEFGEINIDGALIENVDDDGIAEFQNGCLCCVGRDDLAEAMLKLALRKKPPEHVIVELSGLADPVPVAQTVLDPQLKALFRLDGIVGVADAKNLERTIGETPEGAVQLAYASSVVLNKNDLATPETQSTNRDLITKLNPLADVLETTHGLVDCATLLTQHAFDSDWKPKNHQHNHSKDLVSFALSSTKPLQIPAWNEFLEHFILARPGSVYRAKGFLSFDGIKQKILVQTVREIVNLTSLDEPQDGTSTLVVIGRRLDETEYREAFAKTVQTPKFD